MKKFKKQKSRLLDFRKLLDPPATMLNPHLEEVFEFLNYKNKEHPSFAKNNTSAHKITSKINETLKEM